MLLGIAIVVGALVSRAVADENDEDAWPMRLPGLIARFAHPESGVEFTRYEAAPALLLSGEESPDPRLPANGWQVIYRGVIESLRPGKYRFDAQLTGKAELSIGKERITFGNASDRSTGNTASQEVELPLGLSRLEVSYEPAPGRPAQLQLYWQSESFEREPLPSRSLGHEAKDPLPGDTFRQAHLAIEDHNCVACHRPNDQLPLSQQLAKRPAPRLTGAGARIKAGWIYHWLAKPAALRPEAVMPELFASDQRGDVERFAVATFLAGQGGPIAIVPDAPAEVMQQTAAEGGQLFARLGCAVCHERQGDRPPRVTLRALAHKTTPEAIEAFLQKPDAVAPAGRMPTFTLGKLDKRQLALYVMTLDRDAAGALELPAAPAAELVTSAYAAYEADEANRVKFAALPQDEQLSTLAQAVMRSRHCVACHEFKPSGESRAWEPTASQRDFLAIAKKTTGGCMAESGHIATGDSAAIPRFGGSLDRAMVRTFLRDAIKAPATRAPADEAALALARFNCTACHERDGHGGLTPEYINRLGSGEDGASELVTPPSLTQVTAKLTERALRGVLEADERSRPWMSLQMPRFGKARVVDLPVQLAAIDAMKLEADVPEKPAVKEADADEPPDTPLAESGRTLVGSRGFGCTKCHDMLGVPSTGTRGPDLANVPGRIRHPWYLRWIHDPQRIQQGTRMPTIFLNGESPYKDVLGGDPDQQREAIWKYLTLAKSLPPPEGLEEKKLQTLATGNRPIVIRTFLPGTTPRGMAVRFPNNVHAAFDAQMGRVAFAWSGEFLDLGPVWNGRGGHEAHVLGKIFWNAPPGCPWEVTATDSIAPTFAGRSGDPALGALVKDSKLHFNRVSLAGYSVDDQATTLRYRLALEAGGPATFTERVSTINNSAGVGIARDLKVAAPPASDVWLFTAESESAPQWIAGTNSGTLAADTPRVASDGGIRIDQQGHPLLLRLRASSGPAQWVVHKNGERWHLLLKLAPAAAAGERSATLTICAAQDNQPDAWQRLVAEELK